MRLNAGIEAPDFKTESLKGEPVELSKLKGHPVWLAFFRFASCPLCNLRVHQIVNGGPRFEGSDVRVLAVFQSPKEKLNDFVAKQRPPFTLIADPKMDLYRLYGVEASIKAALSPEVPKKMLEAAKVGLPLVRPWQGLATRIPADFLIDREGKIRTAFYGTNITEHISFEAVEEFIAEA